MGRSTVGALLLCLAVSALPASSADIQFTFALQQDGFEVVDFEGGQLVWWQDGAVCFEEGQPDLPGVSYCFVLPQGTSVTGAEFEILSEVTIPGLHDILPVRVVPIGAQPGPYVRRPDIYLAGDAFPSDHVISTFNGTRTGFRLGSVTFTPFSWNPVSGRITAVTEALVTLHVEADPQVPLLRLTQAQIEHAERLISTFVRNPEDLAECRPAVREGGTDWSAWVAIGASSLQSAVTPLVNHRNSTGMSAEYVTTEWITSTYTGWDTAEKIRNYLKDAYNNHGLQYALIIGDWGPTQRISSLYISGAGTLNETADLYYGDLDGSWDADGDHLYGENNDGLNYYSDIAVGRFSTNTAAQVTTQVNKTIEYETISPAGTWRTRALLCGAGLWPEYGYWGSFVCDSICKRIPAGWIETKLYENSGGHPSNQIDVINSGVSYVSPQGHGFSSGIYWYYSPTNMITNSNYTQMTNWGKFPVFHSIACLAGQLSANGCIAERLMFWTSGGAVAVCFNSNNGFGTPPSMGPSEHLEVHFSNQMFPYAVPRVGDMQAAAKDAFKAAGGMSMQNWVLQENNMLGDPALLFITYQTGIEEGGGPVADAPALGAAHPNPTAGAFSIGWSLPAPMNASMSVYDVSGRLVRTLHDGMLAGSEGVFEFDGLDSSSSPLSPGCYFVRLSCAAGSAQARVVVLAR